MPAHCICFKRMCRHFDGKAGKGYVCKAFPAGIPGEITSGKEEHLAPLPGQTNQIAYERAKSYSEMEMFKSKRGF